MKPIRSLLAKLRSSGATQIDITGFDPFDPNFIAEPFATLAALRQQAPVHRLANGSWVISRYEDIARALDDPRLVNSPSRFAVVNARNARRYRCASVANNILPFMDPPGHSEPRRIIARRFYEAFRLEQPGIGEITNNLWRAMPANGDLLKDFATPLCAGILARMIGQPNAWQEPTTVAQFKHWAEWFFYLFSILPDEQTRARLDSELDAARHFLAARIKPGQSALIDSLLTGDAELPGLHTDHIVDNCLLLLADGVNADHALANALLLLLQHPELVAALREQPQKIPKASEELLRLATPSLFIARRAAEDLEVGGHRIGKDSGVLLMLASANRDETVFERGDQLDIDRPRRPQLTFGRGAHACLGRHLVNALMEQAIETVIRQPVRLAQPRPQWLLRAGHRWLAELPIRIDR